jgi:hypothetical protein
MPDYTITITDNQQSILNDVATNTGRTIELLIQSIVAEKVSILANARRQVKIDTLVALVKSNPDLYEEAIQSVATTKAQNSGKMQVEGQIVDAQLMPLRRYGPKGMRGMM